MFLRFPVKLQEAKSGLNLVRPRKEAGRRKGESSLKSFEISHKFMSILYLDPEIVFILNPEIRIWSQTIVSVLKSVRKVKYLCLPPPSEYSLLSDFGPFRRLNQTKRTIAADTKTQRCLCASHRNVIGSHCIITASRRFRGCVPTLTGRITQQAAEQKLLIEQRWRVASSKRTFFPSRGATSYSNVLGFLNADSEHLRTPKVTSLNATHTVKSSVITLSKTKCGFWHTLSGEVTRRHLF